MGLRWLAALGAALVALTGAGLALHVPGAESVGSIARTNVFVAVMALAAVIYLAAAVLVVRWSLPARAVWLVLGVAVAVRLMVLPAYPFLSSDVFRYVWDGRVQNAGINPYRYIPADPVLDGLRDAAIYPHVNRREYAPTIYPPMAQAVFRAVAAVQESTLAMKVAMVGFEALAVGSLLALLRRAALPLSRVLIYAWNPLAVWSFAGNGHVDAAAIGLVGVALVARAWRLDGWAGAALGAAALVKFLPAVLAPALWRRWGWRFVIGFAATVAGLYALYADVGFRVFGFLSSYGDEEGMSDGSGLWLLAGLSRLVPLPPLAGLLYEALAALCLAVLGAFVAFGTRRPDDARADVVRVCAGCALLAGCTMVMLSPHYPWYFAWLALPACVAPFRSVIWLSVAPLLLTLDPFHERFVWASLVYVPACLLAWFDHSRLRDEPSAWAKGPPEDRLGDAAIQRRRWIAPPPRGGSR